MQLRTTSRWILVAFIIFLTSASLFGIALVRTLSVYLVVVSLTASLTSRRGGVSAMTSALRPAGGMALFACAKRGLSTVCRSGSGKEPDIAGLPLG